MKSPKENAKKAIQAIFRWRKKHNFKKNLRDHRFMFRLRLEKRFWAHIFYANHDQRKTVFAKIWCEKVLSEMSNSCQLLHQITGREQINRNQDWPVMAKDAAFCTKSEIKLIRNVKTYPPDAASIIKSWLMRHLDVTLVNFDEIRCATASGIYNAYWQVLLNAMLYAVTGTISWHGAFICNSVLHGLD